VVNQPLVSIIIPCYNAGKYVAEAIQSALDQTYTNKEVIVIDDGSTDHSLDVIRSFAERIRWETGPNRGGCAARNRGLETAKGELIQFLDADDGLYPQKLAIQVPILMSRRCDVVTCEWHFIGGERTRFVAPSAMEVVAIEDPIDWTVSHERLGTSSPIHFVSNLRRIGGFRPNLPCAQEYDLHIRLACSGYSFGHMRGILWYARHRAGSVSSDYRQVLLQQLEILRRARSILASRGALDEQRRHVLADACVRVAVYLFRLGDVVRAEEYMRASREFHARGGEWHGGGPGERLLARAIGPLGMERIRQVKKQLARRLTCA
jgi:glycosyltransferase involved in cell wall biosynthesis